MIRVRTAAFKQYREDASRRRERFHVGEVAHGIPLTQKLLPQDVELTSVRPSGHLAVTVKLSWLVDLSTARSSLETLKETLAELDRQQRRRTALVFENEDRDRFVSLSHDVSRGVKDVETRISRILECDPVTEGPRVARMRLAAARDISTQLQEITKAYRRIQTSQTFDQSTLTENETAISSVQAGGLQQRALLPSEIQHISRQNEIQQIARMMQEVQELFHGTSTLTIQQGSMLDRIDVNIEKAKEGTDKGRLQLHKAEERQRKGWAKQASYVLCLSNGVLVSSLCRSL